MKTSMIIGVLLLVAGIAVLAYRGFNYTSEETVLQVGPVKATAETEKHVGIPAWAGYTALALGGALVVVGATRRS